MQSYSEHKNRRYLEKGRNFYYKMLSLGGHYWYFGEYAQLISYGGYAHTTRPLLFNITNTPNKLIV